MDPGFDAERCAFAAGSGITPVISMVQTVLENEPESRFVLVFGNKSKEKTMFRQNLDAQLDAGIDGIIIAGSLGEASTLSNAEKLELLRFSKQVMNRPVPAILNIAEQSTSCAVQAAREAEENGADGLMLLPPMRYKADARESVEYFKAITSSSSLPVMIYNNPYDYKIEVTLDMFEELANIPSIQAVKESTRDVSN